MANITYSGSDGEKGIITVNDKYFVSDYMQIPGQSLKEKKKQRIRTKAFKEKIKPSRKKYLTLVR
jgi:hypothetical protein